MDRLSIAQLLKFCYFFETEEIYLKQPSFNIYASKVDYMSQGINADLIPYPCMTEMAKLWR